MDSKRILSYRVHGGRIKNAKLDFSVNTNPLGPPDDLFKVLGENLTSIKYYPEENSYSLKKLYAKKWKVKPENIIFGNGASELIFLYINTLKPKRVIIPIPSFSEYYIASALKKCEIILPLYKNSGYKFTFPYKEVIDAISPDSLIILGNPNNPTGTSHEKTKLFDIINEALKKHAYILIDEAFIEFLNQNQSLISFVKDFSNLFVIRSFTKVFTIPGIRLGVGVGNERIVTNMEAARDPWSVNIFSQMIAKYLIDSDTFIEKTREFIIKEKIFIFKNFKGFKKLKIYETHANFYLLQFPGVSSYKIVKYLLTKGIYVRDASSFIGLSDDFIRVSIKKRNENVKFIDSIKFFIK